MFVHPSQVNEVAKRYPEILRARLVVAHDAALNDIMTLQCELDQPSAGLTERIADTLREVSKLRGNVEPKLPGTLPNDGKVIEDTRKLT
jgi:phenylacetate-CoA ligase